MAVLLNTLFCISASGCKELRLLCFEVITLVSEPLLCQLLLSSL